jgi:hypothetical protein
MTYPNNQVAETTIRLPAAETPAVNSRQAAYEDLQSVILKLAVKKDGVRNAPAERAEFTQLVEQALDAYRVYMRTLQVS